MHVAIHRRRRNIDEYEYIDIHNSLQAMSISNKFIRDFFLFH